jgi:cell division protein FtsB
MNTKTIATRSIPLLFVTNKHKVKSNTVVVPWKTLNVSVIVVTVLALVLQMLLVNFLNTANIRLQELADTESALQSEISSLNVGILEKESLDSVSARARELGMTADGNVLYLSTEGNSFVKR